MIIICIFIGTALIIAINSALPFSLLNKPAKVSRIQLRLHSFKNPIKSALTNPPNHQVDKDPIRSRIRINGLRWISPGDFVVNEELGIGRYEGIIQINLTPSTFRRRSTLEPAVLVKYSDGYVWWFKRIIETQLWLYRSFDTGESQISTNSTFQRNMKLN